MADLIKNGGGPSGTCVADGPKLAHSDMVPKGTGEECRRTVADRKQLLATTRDTGGTSDVTQNEIDGDPLLSKGVTVSTTAADLLAKSTRAGTKSKYACIQKKWFTYCNKNGYEVEANTNTYVNFIAEEYNRNLRYGTLKSYKPASTLGKSTQRLSIN